MKHLIALFQELERSDECHAYGTMTKTGTKETPDADDEHLVLATQTKTDTNKEVPDPDSSITMGTKTRTKTQEMDDADSDWYAHRLLPG